ncbi:MAG: hypothetical protein ACK559_27670, partial [bacterium]
VLLLVVTPRPDKVDLLALGRIGDRDSLGLDRVEDGVAVEGASDAVLSVRRIGHRLEHEQAHAARIGAKDDGVLVRLRVRTAREHGSIGLRGQRRAIAAGGVRHRRWKHREAAADAGHEGGELGLL